MMKKIGIICTIGIIVILFTVNVRKKPEIVSCVTTLDRGYLTILVNPIDFGNVKKMEEKISWMCKNDAFETIKLRSDEKEDIRYWHITVYSSKANLEKGKNGYLIKFEQ